MSFVTYTATDNFVDGDTGRLGLPYSMDLVLKSPNGQVRSLKVRRNQAITLGNKAVITHHNQAEQWALESVPMNGALLKQMREFLDSVQGAFFTFAPYHAVADPTPDLRNVMLTKAGYREKRYRTAPTAIAEDSFVFKFSVREVE